MKPIPLVLAYTLLIVGAREVIGDSSARYFACQQVDESAVYRFKGAFAVALPAELREEAVRSVDSHIWKWTGGGGEIVVDYGFKTRGVTKSPSLTCTSPNNLEKRIYLERISNSVWYLELDSPHHDSMSAKITIQAHAKPHEAEWKSIVSSFRWVGQREHLQLLEIDDDQKEATFQNEMKRPFRASRGDFVTNSFGKVVNIGANFVEVLEIVSDEKGGFDEHSFVLQSASQND